MQKEVIQNAKTVELAVELGAKELGADVSKVTYEVMQQPTKGFLGLGAAEAIVKVTYEPTPADKAHEFLLKLLANMGIEAQTSVTEEEDGCTIEVKGEGLGLLIGRHGDVLDSLQYLATLTANKGSKGYYRVSIDVEGYREKRRETLVQLARRMAEKAVKYNRSFALEPMSPYERRIIHSECHDIAGVATYSVGDGADRKVIICPENKMKKPEKTGKKEKKNPEIIVK
ncbi:MAG: protein jag [Clostridia bacterium]|nr:protein jag [Clostridia bacterium]